MIQAELMNDAANIVIAFVAFLHICFLLLEMFFWTKPIGHRIFGLPSEVMASSARLAANQGLYNGFLAAGLVWGLWLGPDGFGIKVFFLVCVIAAGLFGAVTAKRSILWIQALPGTIALALVLLAK
jgi:putative membrane protein